MLGCAWICCLVLAPSRTLAQGSPASVRAPDSTEARPAYQMAPIQIRAARLTPEVRLRDLPGQTSWLDVEPFQLEVINTAAILGQLPGLHIQNFGSIGHVATASIRGSTASQVTVYLDGVPLTRAGAGLMNLAELPFAGVHHIEVYRGFAPTSAPGLRTGKRRLK
jgi:outer membrane receptor for Fe3+-dicitrate